MSLKSQFLAFDRRLARLGVPQMSAWWRAGIGKWLDAYETRECLELWACCGRGASKSTALYKLALFFTLYGDFEVPRGERHWAVCLSRLKEEAAKGIAIIDAWLTLLAVPHSLAGDVIEMGETRRGIRVVAASVAATSGWRAYFVGQDERSKWQLSGVEEVDADEIDTSAAASTATHALAPFIRTGSAWGQFGRFFEVVREGSDVDRVVLGPAATWIAAPHVTEASCRKKERDPRKFRREYACEFQAGELAVFDPDAIERAMGRDVSISMWGDPALIIDPSSGKADAWCWAVVRHIIDTRGRSFVKFELVDAVEGAFWEQVSSDQIVGRVARVAKQWGITRVISDQREAFTLKSAFARYGIKFTSIPWSSSEEAEGSKSAAVTLVRRWLHDDTVIFPRDEKLKRELLSLRESFTTKGSLTYGARGSAHDDRAAVVLTAAMAELSRRLHAAREAQQGPRTLGGFVPAIPFEQRTLGSMFDESTRLDGETNTLGRGHLDFVQQAIKSGQIRVRQ